MLTKQNAALLGLACGLGTALWLQRPARDRSPLSHPGFASHSTVAPSILTTLTEQAARQNNELQPAS